MCRIRFHLNLSQLPFQWIGLMVFLEKLKPESPTILMGKSMVSGEDFPNKTNVWGSNIIIPGLLVSIDAWPRGISFSAWGKDLKPIFKEKYGNWSPQDCWNRKVWAHFGWWVIFFYSQCIGKYIHNGSQYEAHYTHSSIIIYLSIPQRSFICSSWIPQESCRTRRPKRHAAGGTP